MGEIFLLNLIFIVEFRRINRKKIPLVTSLNEFGLLYEFKGLSGLQKYKKTIYIWRIQTEK